MRTIAMASVGVVCLAASTFGADTPVVEIPRSPTVSTWIDLPGFGLQGSHGSDDFGVSSYARFNLLISDVALESADWQFYTDMKDTSKWNASLWLYGVLLDDLLPKPPKSFSRELSSNIDGLGVQINQFLDIEYFNEEALLAVFGSTTVSPSQMGSTRFSYAEFPDSNDPLLTRWRANFSAHGQFIADTPEAARALGAPFAAVPEPATIALLLAGVGGLFTQRRRR